MSFDNVMEAAAVRLATPHSRRRALGLFAGAAAALGLGVSGLADRASAASGQFTLVNQTGQTIWPGVAGTYVPNGGGFELPPGGTATLGVPPNWSGRIWARTFCNFDGSGNGSCETGDCGGVLACNGATGTASATLAEFTLGNGTAPDYYDVSLVDAFNLPMTITPQGGSGCATAGCTANLAPGCPSGLQSVDASGNIVACLSSCSMYGGDQYCCTGSAGSPASCNPDGWPVDSASYFKSGCPDAFSYAFDSVTSTFTCQGGSGYVITFFPFGNGGGAPPDPAPAAAATPAPAPAASPAPAAPAPPQPPMVPQPGQPPLGWWGWPG
jgi:Thaumatin family